jgi:hypothetical protein
MIEKKIIKNNIIFYDQKIDKKYYEIENEKIIKSTIKYYDIIKLYMDYKQKIKFIITEIYKFLKLFLSLYLIIEYSLINNNITYYYCLEISIQIYTFIIESL